MAPHADCHAFTADPLQETLIARRQGISFHLYPLFSEIYYK